jgi:hypothetical protein
MRCAHWMPGWMSGIRPGSCDVNVCEHLLEGDWCIIHMIYVLPAVWL